MEGWTLPVLALDSILKPDLQTSLFIFLSRTRGTEIWL